MRRARRGGLCTGRAALQRFRGSGPPDLDVGEDAEIEQRVLGSVEIVGGELVAGAEVQGATHGTFGDLGVPQPLDDHLAQSEPVARLDLHRDGRAVRDEVDQGIALHLRPGVALVGERLEHACLRRLVRVFVEDRAGRQLYRLHYLRLQLERDRFEPLEADELDVHRLAFVDHELDLHAIVGDRDHAGSSDLGLVVASGAVVSFDAGDVALDDVLVVGPVLEDDAAEEAEEAGRRGGGDLAGNLACGDGGGPGDGHGVDGLALLGDGVAAGQEEGQCGGAGDRPENRDRALAWKGTLRHGSQAYHE